MQNRRRKVGFLRAKAQPNPILDTTVNGINLYQEMNELKTNGNQLYQKYQKIISELETIIRDLQHQNAFLHHQRQELLQENTHLRQTTNSYWNSTNQEIIRVQDNTMEHIYHCEDDCKEILEESQVEDIFYGTGTMHELNVQIPYDSAEKKQKSNSQKTPNLGKSNEIKAECFMNAQQSPMRVFYLLLLQNKSQSLLDMFIGILEQLDGDPTHELFPPYKDNSFWIEFIKGFIQNVRRGTFYDQTEIISYLNANQLIDHIFISALKSRLLFMETDDEFKAHSQIFLGLANQFNLRLQVKDNEYIFYPQLNEEQSQGLEANFSLQISLNNKTTQQKSLIRRQQPLFRVIGSGKVYEVSLQIKYDHYDDNPYSREFKESEDSMDEGVFEGALGEKDLNQRKQTIKYSQTQDSYLYPMNNI